jgi:hypothetical protein
MKVSTPVPRLSDANRVLAHLKRIVFFGLLANVAVCRTVAAQSGAIRSREAFLTARSEDVYAAARDGALRGTLQPLDSVRIEELVKRLWPYAKQFFVLTPNLYWADGQGSSAQPQAGIGLDRFRIVQVRDSLGGAYDDVVLFLLAHEAAHMAQFREYALANFLDSSKVRAMECQADMWAGALLMNYIADSVSMSGTAGTPIPPNVAAASSFAGLQRISSAGALAYHLGTPVWDDQRRHPRPEQRLLCAARGANAGLHLRLVKAYERTRDPKLLAEIDGWRTRDARWFGPGANVWDWMRDNAKALVNYQGLRFDPVGGRFDFIGTFSSLAIAAEQGWAALATAGHRIRFPEQSNSECIVGDVYSEGKRTTSVTCRFKIYQSLAMVRDGYEQINTMLATILASRTWSTRPEVTDKVGRSTSFAFRNGASATVAQVNVVPPEVTVTFAFPRN